MPSQCSRLRRDQWPAPIVFGLWEDLSQGNWHSHRVPLSFSSLSAIHILDSLGAGLLKSQRAQSSHIIQHLGILAQPGLVTTHFNPRSHPPGSSAAGFHTPKGQHAQDTSCQFFVAVSHWPGDCGTTWTRDCIDFLPGPRTRLKNGRSEKRKEGAHCGFLCMFCFEESIKAISPTASVSSHEERRLCSWPAAACQPTGIKKGGGALEGP